MFAALHAVHHISVPCWPHFTLVSSMLVLQLDLCCYFVIWGEKSCSLGSKLNGMSATAEHDPELTNYIVGDSMKYLFGT